MKSTMSKNNQFKGKDKALLTNRTTTPMGFVLSDVVLARPGILEYLGSEIGRDDAPNTVFKVYRPPEELFSKQTMDSFQYVPFSIAHKGMADVHNIKYLQEGFVTDGIARSDNDELVGKIVVNSAEGIKALDQMSEVSIGFYLDYEHVSGITPEGESYDAIQRNIKGNHVALVSAGRCGPACSFINEDEETSGEDIMTDKTSIVRINGLDCAIDTSVVQLVQQQVGALDSQIKTLTDEKATLDSSVTKLQASVDSLEADNTKLKEAASDESINKAVDAKIKLITQAQKLYPEIKYEGKDSVALMREAVDFGNDEKIADNATDEYIKARFDIASENAGKDKGDGLDAAFQKHANKGNKGADDDNTNLVQKAQKKLMESQDSDFIGNNL